MYEVPITHDYRVVDLIRDLDLPTVVVARYQVGTLNHTLMTLDTLEAKRYSCKRRRFQSDRGPEAPDVIEQAPTPAD